MSVPSKHAQQHSFLSLVALADNFRLADCSEPLLPWTLPGPDGAVVGLLRREIVELLKEEAAAVAEPEWEFVLKSEHQRGSSSNSSAVTRVSFAAHLSTPARRSATMKSLCERWRDAGKFADVIGPKKWRGEMYPVYRDPFGETFVHGDGTAEMHDPGEEEGKGFANYAFRMERAAAALFGVVTYGVHMTIYQESGDDAGRRSVKMWVPRRARTKQTWPGFLDNTIAGGIPAGMSAWESLVKEAEEEGNIRADIVRRYARGVGAVSYFYRTDLGWLQPEIEYVYDLRIPSSIKEDASEFAAFVPRPLDGEVESFEFLDLPAVTTLMRAGEFKRNCALVLVDFMVRHGYIAPESEPEYTQLLTRMHGRFEYERWKEGVV